MRILVTGGAGFIASHVVDALIDRGHDVAVVDDLSHGSEDNVNAAARLHRVDLCSPALAEVIASERPEVVVHHAARTSVNGSIADPVDDARVNILGSLNLLQCCIKANVRRVIYASTGGALYGEPQYLPCDEDHPINPLSPYGAAKHAVEHYLYLYRANWGLNYTVLRYPNIYGPRQDSQGEAGVVAIFSDHMQRGADVTIYGTGEQERDFLYVSDVVRANLAVLERGGAVYNLGSGGSVSVNELFQRMRLLAGYRKQPVYATPRSGEVFKIYLNTKRISDELGWAPQVSLDQGLACTLESYKSTRPGGR